MKRLNKNESKYEAVLSELFSICTESENKASDRIAAAKLLLEHINDTENQDEKGEIRIVFDGVEKELTE